MTRPTSNFWNDDAAPAFIPGMNTRESAILDYVEEVAGVRVINGGNLGSAYEVATLGSTDVIVRNATLNTASCALSFTGLVADVAQRVLLLGVQDVVGGRSLTVGGQDVPVPTAASAPFGVQVIWDGTDVIVSTLGGGGGSSQVALDAEIAARIAADSAEAAARVAAAATHEADTTNVHGIADTSSLFQFEDIPADRGFKSWNYQPGNVQSGNAPAAGSVYGQKCRVPVAIPAAKANVIISTIGSGGTALANCYVAIFDKLGQRLGVSADQSSAWSAAVTSRLKEISLTADSTGSLDLPGGPTEYVYVVRLIGTQSTTACSHAARAQVSGVTGNIGLVDPTSTTAFKAGVIPNSFLSGAAQTAMPTSITMESVTAGVEFWAGLS